MEGAPSTPRYWRGLHHGEVGKKKAVTKQIVVGPGTKKSKYHLSEVRSQQWGGLIDDVFDFAKKGRALHEMLLGKEE